ncbi:MAG: ArnT family glycosyltransferase [Saprospiraceae bacterium]
MFKKETFFWMAVAAIFFIPFIGNVHLFDWDEINFAEIAREMHFSGNYIEPQINFQPFLEKPPLFFWLQAFFMNLFGVGEFAARFPNALLGVVQLPVLYLIGNKISGKEFAGIWTLVYFGTLLPHLYFKSGIIDPWFNFFIFLSLVSLFYALHEGESRYSKNVLAFAAGSLAGLAVLTKGPVALLIIGICFVFFAIRKKLLLSVLIVRSSGFAIGLVIFCGSWLLLDYFQNGPTFIEAFTIRQWELLTTKDAGHGGFLFYHVVVLLFGCFPASVFLIQGMIKKSDQSVIQADFAYLMKVLFWFVLVLFSLVQTKIVHYSSLCYFPLTYLAAISIQEIISKKWKMEWWMKVLLGLTAFPFVLAPFLMTYLGFHMDALKPLLKADPFAVENLNAEILWQGWEFMAGFVLFAGLYLFYAYNSKGKIRNGFVILFAGTALYVQLTLIFFIAKIEKISQNANIEFWEKHSNENCYLSTFGYKSYTQYFYGQVKPSTSFANADSLVRSKVDKNLLISCKVNKRKELEELFQDEVFLYQKNGFYFYLRPASGSSN